MKLSPGETGHCCGPVLWLAIQATPESCWRSFLKHCEKKSNHDCFSFLQRNRQVPTGRYLANTALSTMFWVD
ncbi:MAG: hypothetical protein NTU56_12425 [Proteobacteria bacterium]|nr:hypothetical protein [Pseudomonadota bacterium]